MQLALWAILSALVALAALFIVAPQAMLQRGLRLSLPTLAGAVVVPALSITLYLLLGSPRAVTEDRSPHSARPVSRGVTQMPVRAKGSAPVSELVDGLAERLGREPGDAGGWLLLARSYHLLHRYEEARQAYANAAALGNVDPGLEAVLMGGAEQAGIPAAAAAISGTVILSKSAADIVGPGDTVFVFARASDGSGMPVAALRRPAKDLPFDFTLTDATAVMPGARLSDLDEASVGVRVSRSGRATDSLEGLEVASQIVSTHSGNRLELVIGPAVQDGVTESAE